MPSPYLPLLCAMPQIIRKCNLIKNVTNQNNNLKVYIFTWLSKVFFSPDADHGEDVADLLHEDDGRVVQPDHAAALAVECRSLRFIGHARIIKISNS